MKLAATILFVLVLFGANAQTNTFPSSGNVGIGTTSPAAKLSFNNLNDGSNGADGITWYSVSPLVYGIFRTPGAWTSPNYQQLKLSWETGITLDPGDSYGKSYVDIQRGGLRVSSGNVGIGATSPLAKLHISSAVARETFRLYADGNTTNYLSMWQGTGAAGIDPIGTGKLYLGYDQATSVYMGNGTGKVGIGTTNPDGKLEINLAGGQLKLSGGTVAGGVWTNASDMLYLADWNSGTKGLNINMTSGNIGIGTFTPGSYKLAVEGKIGAREVNVTTTAWSDYVFNADYKLRPLAEVQQYIEENHHLPEVPSEKEVLANGQNLGEMNAILLKKIEELTLYQIEANKKIEALQEELKKITKP